MLNRVSIQRVILLVVVVVMWGGGTERSVYAQPSDDDFREPDIVLNKANYAAWRDHIAPTQSELGWQKIPWHPTFKDGILAADGADKPLLFWTMNGHPLGCT